MNGFYHEKPGLRAPSPGGVLSPLAGLQALVVRPGALGDTILAMPALRALRTALGPRGRLEVVGYPDYLEICRQPCQLDVVHSVDRTLFSGLFSPPVSDELVAFIDRYDVLAAWCHRLSPAVESLLAAPGRRGFRDDPFPAPGSGTHASEHLARGLERWGLKADLRPPLLAPSEIDAETARRLLAGQGLPERGYLVVHPGSGNPAKNWPPERFAEILRRARCRGWPSVVVEGPADGDRQAYVSTPRIVRPPLKVLAEVLRWGRAYVGNDSGVSHLAAAVGIRTVALFGPTDPVIWGPLGPRVQVVPHEASPERVWTLLREGL